MIARDDKDLGDEADAGSGRPDASAAADDGATTSTMTKLKSPEVLLMNRPNSHPHGCAAPLSQQTRSPTLVIVRYAWWSMSMCPDRSRALPVAMNLSPWMNQAG